MTFPDTPLGVKAEIELSTGWTDITEYVAHGGQDGQGHPAAITLQRGRPDEQTTSAVPALASFMLNNIDGRFTTRNPLGPYYPDLTRNTPIRFSIPEGSVYLRLIDDLFTGSCAATPDSSALSITGDTEIQVDFDLADWSGGFLADKWNSTTSQSWVIQLNRDGTVTFFWSTTGTNALSARSTMPIPMQRGALKVTIDVNNGSSGNTVTFYTAPTISGSWTQLGTAVIQSGTTSIFDSVAPVRVARGCVGRFYAFKLLSGIGGTVKASPDFDLATAGASSLTDAQSNVWSITGDFAEFSDRDYRYYGELSSLPTVWDVTGQDVWVQVTAGSLLRRMTQGQGQPVQSAMRRGLLGKTGTVAPVAYWPCEDEADATFIASALSNGPTMKWTNGTATLASDTSFLCSNALPVMNGAIFAATVPSYTSNGSIVVRFLLDIPSSTSAPDGAIICKVYTNGDAGSLFVAWDATDGELQFFARDPDGTLIFDSTPLSTMQVKGSQLWVSMEVNPSGSDIVCKLSILPAGSSISTFFTHTITTASVGKCTAVHFNTLHDLSITDFGFGHVSVQSGFTALENDYLLLAAWAGEVAADRFIRLCNESDVTGLVWGYPDTSVPMGPQLPDTLLNLIQACEDTDRGQIYEPRDMPGFSYRTSASMTNQSSQLTLDYSADNLVSPLSPTDDDQFTVNDVTAQNLSGSSARSVLDDGSAMSISPPRVGVGDYVTSVSVNVADDDQLPDEAGWIMHVGTVNEERYPSVVVDLAVTQPAVADIAAAVKALDIGDYFQITDTPDFMPPGPVNALAWGIQEVLGDFCYEVTLNAVPESPYEVGVVNDASTGLGKVDTIGSSLHTTINTSATSISIDVTDTYLWTTTSGDWPIDIIMGGEQMTVTAISGSSSPQTFTVTRSVNGVVKSHTAGEAVSLHRPSIVALTG